MYPSGRCQISAGCCGAGRADFWIQNHDSLIHKTLKIPQKPGSSILSVATYPTEGSSQQSGSCWLSCSLSVDATAVGVAHYLSRTESSTSFPIHTPSGAILPIGRPLMVPLTRILPWPQATLFRVEEGPMPCATTRAQVLAIKTFPAS
jgi:hypothetical protein